MPRLFNLDLHSSVIEDVKYIFKKIFDDISIVSWYIGSHGAFFNKRRENVKILNERTWRNINKELIEKFNHKYDSFLKRFDGFIVTHTPVFCLLFEKYNKPIFLVNTCRYDQPYCNNWYTTILRKGNCIFTDSENFDNWEYLDMKLNEMWKKQMIFPVSNNKADQCYLKLGTGIQSKHIPSLCLYTYGNYNNIKDKILICMYEENSLDEYLCLDNTVLKNKCYPQGSGYKWQELYNYKALIVFPYEISTMSIAESYSANIPMFFPSREYLKKLVSTNKLNMWVPYIKSDFPLKLTDALGPNWMDFWINNADFYDSTNLKYLIYFDGVDDLKHKIATTNFEEISKKMKSHNETRRQICYQQWKNIIEVFLYNKDKFIFYNYLPTLTTHVMDYPKHHYIDAGVVPRHDYPGIITKNIQDGDKIFVKTDILYHFFSQVYPHITNNFNLYTGSSDLSPPDDLKKYLRESKIISWSGQNIKWKNSKLKIVPIGVEERERKGGNQIELYQLHINRTPFLAKKDKLLITFLDITHDSRKELTNLFEEQEYCDIATKLEFGDYMKKIDEYKFVLSPRGNGIDTHRFWEILIMGSIPVVEKDSFSHYYSKFPCMVVDSFKTMFEKDIFSNFTWNEYSWETFIKNIMI